MDRVPLLLQQMRQSCDLALGYVEGMDHVSFLADKRTQQAVVLNLMVIGEIATRIDRVDPGFATRNPTVPIIAMRGMRNRIAHGYFEVDPDIVWATVQTALPELAQSLERIDHPPPLT
jgi:uncharacterized protein with HEPN domain